MISDISPYVATGTDEAEAAQLVAMGGDDPEDLTAEDAAWMQQFR